MPTRGLVVLVTCTFLGLGWWLGQSAFAQPDRDAAAVPVPHAPDAAPDPLALTPDRATLSGWIEEVSDARAGNEGDGWRFTVGQRPVVVLTDPTAERMRIISPIAPAADLDPEVLTIMMRANFDRALDARYAVHADTLWSAYIHPLGPLTEGQFKDAVRQVVTLAENFGTTYSSSDKVFGGNGNADDAPPPAIPDGVI
ncbi:MAG: hypothetical protein AAGG38_09075 [Planctomycetota bacterium]